MLNRILNVNVAFYKHDLESVMDVTLSNNTRCFMLKLTFFCWKTELHQKNNIVFVIFRLRIATVANDVILHNFFHIYN